MPDLHLSVDPSRRHGLARDIAAQLREAIRSGRLAAGTRLPASRVLARDLGVSRGVVVEAYAQLVAGGFLTSRTGSGTVVADVPAAGAGGGTAAGAGTRTAAGSPPKSAAPKGNGPNMRIGTPDLSAFPRRQWLAAVRRVLAELPDAALGYPDPGGVPELREALAAYLRRVRAADVTADRITVVGGVAHGLSLVTRILADEYSGTDYSGSGYYTREYSADEYSGREYSSRGYSRHGYSGHGYPRRPDEPLRLAVEDPTSTRQLPLLTAAGLELVPVPVDAEGMRIQALADTGANAVLLTPAHQYPTGVVLSPARRAELGAWLDAEPGRIAIEDDYDAEFRYDREPVGCLQGLRPDRTVLIGSTSKALAPGLRLGWIAAPARITAGIRRLRAQSDLGSPVLDQHTLAHLIECGDYDRHIRAMRLRYRAKRDAVVEAFARHLPEARVEGVSAGQHVYVELPPGSDEARVLARARKSGVDVPGAAEYRLATSGAPALVLGFAGLSVRAVDDLVRTIAVAATGG